MRPLLTLALLALTASAMAQTGAREIALPDSFAVDDFAPWPGDSTDFAVLLRGTGARAATQVPRLVRLTPEGEIVSNHWLREGRETGFGNRSLVQGTGRPATFFPSAYGLGVRYPVDEFVSENLTPYTYALRVTPRGIEEPVIALVTRDKEMLSALDFGGTVLSAYTWTETYGTEKATVGFRFWERGDDPLAARARGQSEDLPDTGWRAARAMLVPTGGAVVWTRGEGDARQFVAFWLTSLGAISAPASSFSPPVARAEIAALLPGPGGGILAIGTGLVVENGAVTDARLPFLAAARPNAEATVVRLPLPEGHRAMDGLNLGDRLLFLSMGDDGVPTLTSTDAILQPTGATPFPRFTGLVGVRLIQFGGESYLIGVEAEGATSRLVLSDPI